MNDFTFRMIKLTKGYFAIVDPEDYQDLIKYSWRAAVQPDGQVYAAAYIGGGRKNGKQVYMHQMILGFPGSKVDHRNGNGLNNRRYNLRTATDSQNQMNKRIGRNNTSGFKGVSFQKSARKFKAYIRKEGKLHHLGLFMTAEEAAAAYNRKALELFGEFASLNDLRS
jgi:hypothetical protein